MGESGKGFGLGRFSFANSGNIKRLGTVCFFILKRSQKQDLFAPIDMMNIKM